MNDEAIADLEKPSTSVGIGTFRPANIKPVENAPQKIVTPVPVGKEVFDPEAIKLKKAQEEAGALLDKIGIKLKTEVNDKGEKVLVGMVLPPNLLADELKNEEKEKKALAKKLKEAEDALRLKDEAIKKAQEEAANSEAQYKELMLKMRGDLPITTPLVGGEIKLSPTLPNIEEVVAETSNETGTTETPITNDIQESIVGAENRGEILKEVSDVAKTPEENTIPVAEVAANNEIATQEEKTTSIEEATTEINPVANLSESSTETHNEITPTEITATAEVQKPVSEITPEISSPAPETNAQTPNEEIISTRETPAEAVIEETVKEMPAVTEGVETAPGIPNEATPHVEAPAETPIPTVSEITPEPVVEAQLKTEENIAIEQVAEPERIIRNVIRPNTNTRSSLPNNNDNATPATDNHSLEAGITPTGNNVESKSYWGAINPQTGVNTAEISSATENRTPKTETVEQIGQSTQNNSPETLLTPKEKSVSEVLNKIISNKPTINELSFLTPFTGSKAMETKSWIDSLAPENRQLVADITTLNLKEFLAKNLNINDDAFTEKILEVPLSEILDKETEKGLFGGPKGITVLKEKDMRDEIKLIINKLKLLNSLTKQEVVKIEADNTEPEKAIDENSMIFGNYINMIRESVLKLSK